LPLDKNVVLMTIMPFVDVDVFKTTPNQTTATNKNTPHGHRARICVRVRVQRWQASNFLFLLLSDNPL
jgi:hypothetical protein